MGLPKTVSLFAPNLLHAMNDFLKSLSLLALTSLAISDAKASPAPSLDCPGVDARYLDTTVYQHSVEVRSSDELVSAVKDAKPSTKILLKPGTYAMQKTLWVGVEDLAFVGDASDCKQVTLQGPGMENKAGADNAPHGIWSNSAGLKIQNLTIRDYYYHGLILNADANRPRLIQARILDTGQQQLKANPKAFADGVDGGSVISSVIAYTSAPTPYDHGGGTGYTNGVDVHGGANWQIHDSVFLNFHTPDNADHLWNPAILMWNGASNTQVTGNTFYKVDRAIAFGLIERERDHFGGVIANNTVVNPAKLFSNTRRANADAFILIYSSPETLVAHNSLLSNDSVNLGIELRFNSSGSQVLNNLGDKPNRYREGMDKAGQWENEGNILLPAGDELSLSAVSDTYTPAGLSVVPNNASSTRLQVNLDENVLLDQRNVSRSEPNTTAGSLARSSLELITQGTSTAENPGPISQPSPTASPSPDPAEVSAPRAPSRLSIQVN